MIRKFLITIILIILCETSQGESIKDWWQTASFYQIYPRSFQDSNGDGIGDLNGITSRLSYLKEIGIEATWLSPIFKSPMADNGYDISNFTEIHSEFGTIDDFKKLIKRAKDLDIKIILDFVPNHTSDECEWFLKSVNREKDYEDFYVWHDGKIDPQNNTNRLPPSNWVSVFRGSAWTWNDKRKQFYYHQFLDKQPDLNFRNPKVIEQMKEVLKFWLNLGVDGFRIDAVPHIIEKLEADGNYLDEPISGVTTDKDAYTYLHHIYTTDQNETNEILYDWRDVLDEYTTKNGGSTRILLAESYSPLDIKMKYYGNGIRKGVHIPFNFILMELNEKSNARDYEKKIYEWINTMPKEETSNWVLGNHDSPRISTRFGQEKINLLNILLLTLPGISVTYYGEEIGMSDVEKACHSNNCDNRDPERTPMQWNDKISAGFSTNQTTWLSIADNYKTHNVMKQRTFSSSHLNIFKQLKSLRQTNTFQNGNFSISAVNDNVLISTRVLLGDAYITMINLGGNMEYYYLKNINISVECVFVNEFSPNYIGKVVSMENLTLHPFEGIIYKIVIPNPKSSAFITKLFS